jgi:MSHA biogenesis protein MshQ
VASFGTPDVLDGLVAWWKMDEASWNGTAGEVVDSVAGSNNGVSVSGVTTTNGLINRCAYFNGSSGYLNNGNNASIILTNNITISFWVKPISLKSCVFLSHGNYNNSGWYIYSAGDSKFSIWPTFTSGVFSFESTENSLQVNKWTFVAITFNDGESIIYVDGVENKRFTYTGYIKPSTFRFLVNEYDIGSGLYSNSLIDDIRYYGRAISSNDVFTVFNKFKP